MKIGFNVGKKRKLDFISVFENPIIINQNQIKEKEKEKEEEEEENNQEINNILSPKLKFLCLDQISKMLYSADIVLVEHRLPHELIELLLKQLGSHNLITDHTLLVLSSPKILTLDLKNNNKSLHPTSEAIDISIKV